MDHKPAQAACSGWGGYNKNTLHSGASSLNPSIGHIIVLFTLLLAIGTASAAEQAEPSFSAPALIYSPTPDYPPHRRTTRPGRMGRIYVESGCRGQTLRRGSCQRQWWRSLYQRGSTCSASE